MTTISATEVYKSLRASGRNGESGVKPIHVKPQDKEAYDLRNGDPSRYGHIPGAPHEKDWETDIRGTKDCFLIGSKGSWGAGRNGPADHKRTGHPYRNWHSRWFCDNRKSHDAERSWKTRKWTRCPASQARVNIAFFLYPECNDQLQKRLH